MVSNPDKGERICYMTFLLTIV